MPPLLEDLLPCYYQMSFGWLNTLLSLLVCLVRKPSSDCAAFVRLMVMKHRSEGWRRRERSLYTSTAREAECSVQHFTTLKQYGCVSHRRLKTATTLTNLESHTYTPIHQTSQTTRGHQSESVIHSFVYLKGLCFRCRVICFFDCSLKPVICYYCTVATFRCQLQACLLTGIAIFSGTVIGSGAPAPLPHD